MRFMHLRIGDVLREYDTEPVELVFALIAITWGAWIAMPWFDIFSTSTFYGWMATHGSRFLWGAGLMIVGSHQLVCVGLGRVVPRKVAAILSMAMWEFLAVILFAGDRRAPALPILTIYALSQLWVIVRR